MFVELTWSLLTDMNIMMKLDMFIMDAYIQDQCVYFIKKTKDEKMAKCGKGKGKGKGTGGK